MIVFFFKYTPPPEISPFPSTDPLPSFPSPARREPLLHPGPIHLVLPLAGGEGVSRLAGGGGGVLGAGGFGRNLGRRDRKSTRLNSSHANISYAVFCLK